MNLAFSAHANKPPNIVARKIESNGKRMNMNTPRKIIRLIKLFLVLADGSMIDDDDASFCRPLY